MKREVKAFIKYSSLFILSILSVYSLYRLIKLIKKYDVLSILYGFNRLNQSDNVLVDISQKNVKFIGLKSEASVLAFKEHLNDNNYTLIGKFGRSDLYDCQGTEIIVKRTTLFNRYYLFEVFNERFFDR